jgi:AAA15 family ATPase/GTPase
MYISKINIENIRAIKNLTIHFPENPAGWHVLIGDNGCGKTTILRAIAITLIPHTAFIEQNAILWLSKGKDNGKIVLTIQRDERFDTHTSEDNIFTEKTSISKGEEGQFTKHKNHAKGLGKGWFSMSFGINRRFSNIDDRISIPKIYAHASILNDNFQFSRTTEWIKTLALAESRGESAQLSHLKVFLNATDFLPNNITFDRYDTEKGIIFRNKEAEELNISDLSEGYQSILILFLEVVRQMRILCGEIDIYSEIKKGNHIFPISGVILIDEIDAHLHPTWQARIGQWFTERFPNIQFIVSTHSPIICRAAGETGNIWKIENGTAREIVGTEKEKTVYGDISDALSTRNFGITDFNDSNEALKRQERLFYLNDKEMLGLADEAEKQELYYLRTFISHYAPSNR